MHVGRVYAYPRSIEQNDAGTRRDCVPCTRVVWLIKGLGPGGAERLLVTTAAAIDRERFSLEVFYLLPFKDHLVSDFEALGIPTRCLDVRDERDLRWTMKLRRALVDERFDIVHAHSPYVASFARIVVRTLPRHMRPRFVTTEHNPWTTFKWPTRVMNRLTSPLNDATIAVSTQTQASMSNRVRRRSETLTHGIDTAAVRSLRVERRAVRAELDVSDDVFLVGTIANYHPKKNWPSLLHAAQLVREQGVPVRFCAVGQGPLETAVKALRADLDLEDTVILTGFRQDAVRLMAGCDAFVLASRWEGMPVALMEASALSLPIIATGVGGIPEVFRAGEDALLVPSGDPQALAAAVISVATDEALRTSLARSSASLAPRFEARGAVRRIETIYEDLLP